jgi:glycerol-3-phosphate dehydrogenase
MAEDVVDRVVRALGKGGPGRTRRIPLGLRGALEPALKAAASEAAEVGLPPTQGERLVARFGDDWTEAIRLVREDGRLGQPAVDGLPVLAVELELARTREMALTAEDVLVRRTRLATMDERVVRPSAGSGRDRATAPAGPAPPG